MQEIAAGIHRWTAPHPEWRTRDEWGHEVVSYALVCADSLALVDPLLPPDGTPEWEEITTRLDKLAAAAPALEILITIPYHTRSAEPLYRRFRGRLPVTLWGHPAVARRFLDADTPLTPIVAGARAGTAAVACPIGKPRRYETPLFFPEHRALAFGDALVTYEGAPRVWQPGPFTVAWYRDRFLPTLRPLMELDVERLLFTHGEPILSGGRAALGEALAAAPFDLGS